MFQKTSAHIIQLFKKHGVVNDENQEIYQYGVQQGFTLLLNIISTLLIGILFHQIFEFVIYMLLFIPLRSFAGGYHASTPQRCYVYSLLCVFAVMFLIKYSALNDSFCYIIGIICAMIIFFLSPVEDHNKSLDEVEIKRYRLRSRAVLVLESVLFVIAAIVRWETGIICIALTFLSLALMLVFGRIKNRIQCKFKKDGSICYEHHS